MDGVINLIKVMIWGGTTLLTPEPIDVHLDIARITLKKPISAITAGASIKIDITKYIKATGVVASLKEIDENFPDNCISIKLISTDQEPVVLSKQYGGAGNDSAAVYLASQSGIPTGLKFHAIEISSCKLLESINIEWINFSK